MIRLRNIKLFSKEWFAIWQPLLLYYVNHWDKNIREEIRLRLGIPVNRNIRINRIYPNSYRLFIGYVKDGRYFHPEFQHIFYGKNFYSEALYKELLPLWNLMHEFDIKVANRFIPLFNLGFDTLTSYPNSGYGGANLTCDGNITRNANETWAAIITASSGTSVSLSSGYDYAMRNYNTQTGAGYYCTRSYFGFDTSALTSNAVISAAYLYLRLSSSSLPDDNNSVLYFHKPILSNANNLQYSDYGNMKSGGNWDFNHTWWADGTGWNGMNKAINSTSFNKIEKNGVTKFSINGWWDETGNSPARDNYTSLYMTDNSNIAYRPKLTITYIIRPYIGFRNIQNTMTQIRM